MNKKKKLANKKHRKTKARLKALRVTSLSKANKKAIVKKVVEIQPKIEKKVVADKTTGKKTTTKKTTAKKITTKKTTAKKTTAKKKK